MIRHGAVRALLVRVGYLLACLMLGVALGGIAMAGPGYVAPHLPPSLASLSQATIIGRASGAGTGAPSALTSTQATAILDAATTSTAGIRKITPFAIGPFVASAGTALPLTNIAAATTEMSSVRRAFGDTTNATQVMLVWQGAGTAPNAGAHGGVQCSADQSTWFFADGSADGDLGSEGPQITLTLNTLVWSGWTTLGSACQGERAWRVLTDDGDGAADPTVATAYLLAR